MSARWWQGLGAVGAMAVLAIVLWAGLGRGVGTSQPIRWVAVEGVFERVSAEQIRAAAAAPLEAGFFAVDLAQVQRQVELLPWVRSVEVRKSWPDTVRLRVVEHKPLARWGQDRLVSDLGQVFAVAGADRIQGLVSLDGPDEGSAAQVVALYQACSSLLSGTGFDVVALKLSRRGAWTARLNTGVLIEMGAEDPLPRFTRLVAALEELMADPLRHPQRIDLRYTNGLAVKWQTVAPDAAVAALAGEDDAAAF